MAAVNLPDNPANGTTQTVGGITYTYNSSKGYWTAAASSGGGGGGGASVTTDDSAPGSPSDGDLWYDTDDGGMFVYYQDTDSSQWVEVIGSQGSPGPAGAAGASGGAGVATVVANTTALLAISSPSAGDQAYVTANNTLYFYNGSGWYKIALINTAPTISGVNATYNLAVDGTATTVTVVASDPEGLPITYSIASDTSGNIATVSQGTGASSNVWTITPSTNTSYAGSFTLTFRASDGVNFGTAASTFTLAFQVQNSKYTSSLITSVGANNATNQSFDDKSTNDLTLTPAGDCHQVTYGPYRHAGHSVNTSQGNYFTVANHADTDLSSGDWTIELWAYAHSAPGVSNVFLAKGTYVSTLSYIFAVLANGSLEWSSGTGSWSATSYTSTAGDFVFGQWNHIAAVRDGTSIHMYCNGTRVSTHASATMPANTNDPLYVGHYVNHNTYAHDGYIRDLRILKGTALYTGTSYTVPDEPLTAITNTKLLLCHLPYFVDGSATAHAITRVGSVEIRPKSPYDNYEYSSASHGGSIFIDGSGNDYFDAASTTAFDFGTGDFTVEFWMHLYNISGEKIFFETRAGHNDAGLLIMLNSGVIKTLTSGAVRTTGGTSIRIGEWYHVAIVRDSTSLRTYLNGTLESGSASYSTAITSPFNKARIGARFDGANTPSGNFSDIRVVKGTAVYTGNFTPPASPLGAVTNTTLLVQGTDAGIIDKSQSCSQIELNGNAKSSTTQTKYLTSSMYFDGNGDYIHVKPRLTTFYNMTGPYTIEFWFYADGAQSNNYPTIFGTGSTSWAAGAMGIRYSPTGYANKVAIARNGSNNVATGYPIISSSTYAVDTWHHVALSRDASNNWRLFVNGSETGTSITDSNAHHWAHGDHSRIGNNIWDGAASAFKGYVSDLRITKGLARYTANFTAPTAALKG